MGVNDHTFTFEHVQLFSLYNSPERLCQLENVYQVLLLIICKLLLIETVDCQTYHIVIIIMN